MVWYLLAFISTDFSSFHQNLTPATTYFYRPMSNGVGDFIGYFKTAQAHEVKLTENHSKQ
jgi:phosphodiesterase/alkaline phosphatase D-like protein